MAWLESVSGVGGGGQTTLNLTVSTSGVSRESYGNLQLPSNHTFKKLKIDSYNNIGNSCKDYPAVTIGTTRYNRPTEGTVFDITGLAFIITCCANVGNYSKTGVNIELS